ncbi:hypothetical protein [Vulcanococcus sp.]|uniref:hypothetical protein n=1 Tax=Vulcanococcus sp. TaxID=2856995 RepID=UPI003BFECA3A
MAIDVSSFLSEGAQIPEGSALKATQSETVLPPWYTDFAQQLMANQQALMQRPYETAPMPRVAGFSDLQQQAFAAVPGAANAYQAPLQQATQATQGLMGQTGAAAAQPYAQQAAQQATNLEGYMNPYQQAVVDRIAQLGQRNLSENILPQIEGRYVQAGQLGFGARDGAGTPSGMMTDVARAVRGTQEAVLAEQSGALQAGYTQAQQAAQADLARQAQLASTMGGLAGQDVSRGLAGAEQLAGLGEQAQTLGLTGAGAVGAAGAQQQAQEQRNLDVAYQDFLRQQGYPQEQINAALGTFGGVAKGVPTQTVDVGIVPQGTQGGYSPSTAATIGGTLSGLGALVEALKGK